MGKKSKIGKQRRDKFYHLAKETGYRSRAAFKLIQLNRKFEFLQKSRICIDLCAAPGGWMQVAKQNMPVSSIVIGVDLYPIKPVPGCINLQEDITTEKCRVALQKELQTWKADVVMNDGAPNVGANWLHDAYQQSCLTLSALKLVTHFLRPGGWFITKVFRSRDYHPLMWVLKQLFKKVHATKPQASRTESAEIFVVCQHFKAPDKLDTRFLDPNHVFAELQMDPSVKQSVFHPEKQKKTKADGYPEGDYTLHHKMTVSEFVACEDAVAALQRTSEIEINDPSLSSHSLTTAEVRACCSDIRVLGRKDLRLLLGWWKALRQERACQVSPTLPEVTEHVPASEGGHGEEVALAESISQLEAEGERERRRRRKRTNRLRQKMQQKLDLRMVLKDDEGPREEAHDLFSLKQVTGEKALQKLTDQMPDFVADSDESGSEVQTASDILRFSKDTAEESELEVDPNSSDEDDYYQEGLALGVHDKGEVVGFLKTVAKEENPLLTDLDPPRNKKEKKEHNAALWFKKEAFQGLEQEDDEDLELDQMASRLKVRVPILMGSEDDKDDSSEHESDDNSEVDNGNTMNPSSSMMKMKQNQQKSFDVVPKSNDTKLKRNLILDSEGLALGTLIVSSKRSRRDLMDSGWNRYTFGDEKLPDWFVEDEKKHMSRPLPVPPVLVREYNERKAELNVRPIKKVVEAKTRKKKRALLRLERARKKVETIMDNVDVSEREKARQVRQLYKKAKGNKKPEVSYVVAKKHMAAKRMRRPPGINGPYKVVDPRMKKDNHSTKSNKKNKRGFVKNGKKNGKK